jgi:branched-chain amino acid transport system substrate-binding protein
VVIGATLSLTGSAGVLGGPVRAGYQQEVADVNAAGGVAVGGRKDRLKLVVLNNASNPATAAGQASELVVKDHAAALLGAATSPIVSVTALEAEQLRVPFVTSLAPVEAFASGDKQGWTYSWDFFFDEKQQAATAAKALAAAKSNKKVVLFTDSEPDSIVERPLYEAAFAAAGLDVVGDYTFPAGTASYSSFIADAKAKGAQLVAGQLTTADGVALWKQLKSSGLRPRAAFVADAAGTGSWWQQLGATAQDTLSGSFWSPGQATAAQLAKITPTLGKEYAGSPGYAAAAVAYAAAEIVTGAISRAGSTSPARLNTAIGQSRVQTTAGLITFSPATHTAATPYYVTQWQNDRLVQVQPPVPGSTYQQPATGLG